MKRVQSVCSVGFLVAMMVASVGVVAQKVPSPNEALTTMPMFGIIGDLTTTKNATSGVTVVPLDMSFNTELRAWREYNSLGVKTWRQLSTDGIIRSGDDANVCSSTSATSKLKSTLNLLYAAIGGNLDIKKNGLSLAGSAMVRGKDCWVLECTSCLPTGMLSGGYKLQWFFENAAAALSGDDFGPLRSLKVTLDSAETLGAIALQVNIAWLSTAIPVEELDLSSVSCIHLGGDNQEYTLGDAPKVQSRNVMVPESTAFPSLPSTFRGFVEVTFLNQSSFVLEEQFHPVSQFARTTQRGLYKDVAGRRVDIINEVDGKTSLVYQSTNRRLAYRSTTSLTDKMLNYFFDPAFSCSKNLFGSSVIADSVGSLLLKDSTAAIYMGPVANLRGYPLAYYWQSDVNYGGGFIVEWYFDSPSTDGKLLRMVIKGTGTPPFFPHRPFFQLPAVIPEQYAQIACHSLAGPRGCFDELEDVAITYDFFGVGPLSATFSTTPVTECLKSANYNAFPPPSSCSESSSAGDTFIFFLISALIGAIVGGVIVYWRTRSNFFEFLKFEEERRATAATEAATEAATDGGEEGTSANTAAETRPAE